jgi:opacity protein-like surface antigen
MKKYIYILGFILISASSFGQGMFAVTYDIGLPVGNTSDFVSKASFRGFGIEARGFIYDNLSYGGSFNWAVFYEEFPAQEWNIDGDTRTAYGRQFRYINTFPVMATIHSYFGEWDETRIYAGAGIGPQKIDQRTEVGLYSLDSNKWRFGLAPEVGILIPVNFNTSINLAVKYQHAFKAGDAESVSYLNFKIGFAYM